LPTQIILKSKKSHPKKEEPLDLVQERLGLSDTVAAEKYRERVVDNKSVEKTMNPNYRERRTIDEEIDYIYYDLEELLECESCNRFFPTNELVQVNGRMLCPDPLCSPLCDRCDREMILMGDDKAVCLWCNLHHKLEEKQWIPIEDNKGR
jgi:hypothetical protein